MAHKKTKPSKVGKQVAALPVCLDHEGCLRVLLQTSRETGRFIISKGWPEKGMKDWQAASMEAREEVGIVGLIGKKPFGRYTYWKRLTDSFALIRVKVFILRAERHLSTWREKGQRRMAWFTIEDAVTLIDDPGLIPLLERLKASDVGAQPLR